MIRAHLASFVVLIMSATAAFGQVRDDAHIFSADAVALADTALTEMNVQHHRQLVIETFAAIRPDQSATLKSVGKDRFFRDWLTERAKAARVSGVMVLVCMNPRYVMVGAGINTRRTGRFTENNVSELRQTLQQDFHAGHYNQGLGDAIDMVDRTYTANAAASTQPTTQPSPK